MKRLGLLRHAKSDWGDPSLDDFARPLNARGREAAERMGRELRKLGLAYDLAMVSTARRASETFVLLEQQWGGGLEVRPEPKLYGASVDRLLAVIAETPVTAEALLVVGHNPGLHDLSLRLAGSDPAAAALAGKLPTASLVEIALDVESWDQAGSAEGRLLRFLRPSDLG